MWEITESGEFCKLKRPHAQKIFQSIYSLLNSADIDREFCTATGTSKCTPLHMLLTHPTAFGARLLDSGNESPYKSDLLFFNYIPPPPWPTCFEWAIAVAWHV